MYRFGFLFSFRFWAAFWIAALFVGLAPLSPAVELIMLVAFLSHVLWFVRGRLCVAAQHRALARAEQAEEEEYRPQRRQRALAGDSGLTSDGAQLAAPTHHGIVSGLVAEQHLGMNA
jgi:hypothetical protein